MMNALTEYLGERYTEVEPLEFYREIFPAGALEKKGEYVTGEYCGILVAVTDKRKADGKRKVCRYSVTDDLDAIAAAAASNDFCLMSPISYAGKERTAVNARVLYAIAVDVDRIHVDGDNPYGLGALMEKHIELLERIPRPTFIVSSGTGLHLYYVLSEPVNMFPDVAKELQLYKRELTRMIWHDSIVDIRSPRDVQYEGIYQGFRVVGTITKNGARARAFRTGTRVTVEYLNSFVSKSYKAQKAAEDERRRRQKLTLAAAAEKYPEWYERRIINGEPRGKWAVNRNVYEWWKDQIRSGATVGHRYYCLMMLAVYAQKCSRYDPKHNPQPVTRDELEKDSFELMEVMERMTNDEKNHFTEEDVLDALEAFDARWTTYPRASIEYKSGITIPANKRNGRTREEHTRIMRFIRDEINQHSDWNRQGNGRKNKAEDVQRWKLEHPDGTKAECVRNTGMDKKTVYRWWNE